MGQGKLYAKKADGTFDASAARRDSAFAMLDAAAQVVKRPRHTRLVSRFTPTDVSRVAIESEVFTHDSLALRFFVVHSTSNKSDIEIAIKKCGGACLANHDDPCIVVAEWKEATPPLKIHNLITKLKAATQLAIVTGCGSTIQYSDIYHPDWVFDCQQAKRVLSPQPKHLTFVSSSTRARFQASFDEFGDCKDEPVDSKRLSEVRFLSRTRGE
jgi:hypothetical protein